MKFTKKIQIIASQVTLTYKLNYSWNQLIEGRQEEFLDSLDDIASDSGVHFKASPAGFSLSGEDHAVKDAQKFVLKEISKLARVKVWCADKVVLDNFSKHATDIEHS